MGVSTTRVVLAVLAAVVITCSADDHQHEDGRSREQFCGDYDTVCGYGAGEGKYADQAACLANFDLAQYTLRQCFKYHLNVASGSAELAAIHCPHTTGVGPCTLQKSFCWFYGQECTFDNTDANRWDSTAVCEAGWDAATGSQRECMHYHLLAAQESGNPVHCNHAAQQGVCGESAGTFCDALGGSRALSVNHTGTGCSFGAGTNQYADNAACLAKWGAADQKGTFGSPIVTKAMGDVTQRDCIEYHLFAAWTLKDANIHCPHAATAPPCEDAQIGKTFAPVATTSSAPATTVESSKSSAFAPRPGSMLAIAALSSLVVVAATAVAFSS